MYTFVYIHHDDLIGHIKLNLRYWLQIGQYGIFLQVLQCKRTIRLAENNTNWYNQIKRIDDKRGHMDREGRLYSSIAFNINDVSSQQ